MRRVAADRHGLGLRTRFLLLLVGVLVPLGLVGLGVVRTAARSGEAMLRARLEQTLLEMVEAIGSGWVNHRARILDVAEHPIVIAALADRATALPANPAGGAWRPLADLVESGSVRDLAGRERRTLTPPESATGAMPPSATLPVRFPIYAPDSGARLGTLELRVRLSALLPPGVGWSRVGGTVVSITDHAGGALLPAPIGPGLLSRDRFDWEGSGWVAVRHELHEPPIRIALAAPLDPFTAPFARVARQGTLAFLAALAAGMLLATAFTRRLTGPLERLAAAADDIARGRLEGRVHEAGPHEIRRVTRAFNIMTESLQRVVRKLSQREAVAAVGEFAAALAHEVRNPLTSIRLDLERARERTAMDPSTSTLLDRAIAEVERLNATVTGSLRIARSGRIQLERIDLRDPLRAAAHAARPDFARAGVVLHVREETDQVLVRGNAAALEQLALNLLRNSAEALGPGGHTHLTLRSDRGTATVEVADDGPGIPEHEAEHIFEPFFSTKDSGTGLGLPIARRIADAHGADLTLSSAPGAGTVVRLIIPLEHEDAPAATPVDPAPTYPGRSPATQPLPAAGPAPRSSGAFPPPSPPASSRHAPPG